MAVQFVWLFVILNPPLYTGIYPGISIVFYFIEKFIVLLLVKIYTTR